MSRSIFIWFLALFLAGLWLAGCSGGGNITAPGAGEESFKEATAPDDSYQRYLWDFGEVVIDPSEGTVDIIRPRSADFNLNVVVFMQPPAGADSISYKINFAQSNLAQGYVDLDLTLTHPFPQNVYWGHDVRLVLLNNGTAVGKYDSSVRYAGPTEFRMLNPDGYTRWWNMTEFATGKQIFHYQEGMESLGNFIASARVNPYKYFADSVEKTEYPPDIDEATRGEFRSGGSNSRHMILQFEKPGPNPIYRFKYAVDTSWKDPGAPPITTDSYAIDANCREAYQIKVDQTGSTVFWNAPGDFGGDLQLNIEIFDWKQGGGTVEDEIAMVVVESPTLLLNYGGFIDITSVADKNPGTSSNSVFFSYKITNCTPTSDLDQEVFITVGDANTTSYAPPFGSFQHPSTALAAYFLYGVAVDSGPVEKTITVISPNGGEEWDVGSAHTILWSSTGPIANVKIEYSDDGGFTFPHLIVGSTPNDGNFQWDPVADNPTDQAVVKITDVVDTLVFDVSDDVFSIMDVEDSLTVTIPNGGESWQVDTSHNITWESQGVIDDIKIEYYKDDDYSGTAVEIIGSTPNDGTFLWEPIPNDPTETAKVRISDVTNASTFDDSDDFFTITTEAPEGWVKTINNTGLGTQPDQGALQPDISVHHISDPEEYSRGQILTQTGQVARLHMYNDDYTAETGTYEISTSTELDLTDWNRFDQTMYYTNVMGICTANETSPFPGDDNPFMDPGHCTLLVVNNADEIEDEYAGANFGFWLYGDGSPDLDPDNDPDMVPWFHIADWDSGILGGPNDDETLDDVEIFSLMFFSHLTGQPQPNLESRLYLIWQNNPYDGSEGVALGLPGMTQGGPSAGYVDDSEPDVCRLAADDSSGLIAGAESVPVKGWYMLDAAGNVHPLLTYADTEGYWYIPFDDMYLGTGGGLGIDFGGTAVDIVLMPAREFGFSEWNWLAVLVDTGSGWIFKVYNMDHIGPDPENPALTVTEVFTSPQQSGTPAAIDCDNIDFELHILADDGGTYGVTVWQYTEPD